MKKLLFIFNPKSGKAKIKNELFYITDSFVKGGYCVTVYPTQCRRDCYEQIKNMGKKYDVIVSSGGDGTLRESFEGLMTITEEKRPKFGYIPSGTVNDFASGLNIPKSVKRATDAIVNGTPSRCDIGRGNGNYFSYVAGFGAFTGVSYETPQNMKNAIGKVAYLLMGIKSLANIKSYKMRIISGETEFEGEYILGLITNVNHVGGIKTKYNKMSEINDGLFETILIKAPKSLVELPIIATELLSAKLSPERFLTFSSSRVRFESDVPVKWTYDGEFGGENESVDIEVIKNAIEIIL